MHVLPWLCLLGLLSTPSAFKVPSVSLNELLNPDAKVIEFLRHAVSEEGLFAVVIHDSEGDHKHTLRDLVRCVQSGAAKAHSQDVVLKDQTLRTTIATATDASERLPFDAALQEACPDFVKGADGLRSAAATVGQAYAHLLDRLAQAAESDPMPQAYRAAATHAQSLEHFHVYRQVVEGHAEPTLSMHTDLGMFLVMTPPHYFDFSDSAAAQDAEPGFRFKTRSGEVVRPEFPAGSLVVMNGEGAVHWIPSPTARTLHVPPHEVTLSQAVGMGRAWYGRMYMPPKAAQVGGGLTFAQYWAESMAAVQRAPTGEVPLRQLLDQGSCKAGELYCWMKCMNTTGLGCQPQAMVCTDINGTSWPENFLNATGQPTHCFNCTLRCPAQSPSPSAVPVKDPTTGNACSLLSPAIPLLLLCLLTQLLTVP